MTKSIGGDQSEPLNNKVVKSEKTKVFIIEKSQKHRFCSLNVLEVCNK